MARALQTLFLIVAFAIGPAAAQDGAIPVVSGLTATLATSAAEMTVTALPKRGSAKIATTDQGSSKTYELRYTAPSVTEPTADSVTYKVAGGTEQALAVMVVPPAAGLAPDAVAYAAGFRALFVLFVLAVVLESALAIVFNWRPFVENLNARAVRPLVSVAVALVFVSEFDLDVVTSLVNAFNLQHFPPGAWGRILTALVIAGGSAGVNNLLVALGYRQQRNPETVAPKPPPDKAWIAVRLKRNEAVGPVEVFLGTPVDPPGAAPPVPLAQQTLPLVSVISGTGPASYFLADRSRFPRYGGHAVAKDTVVAIRLTGRNQAGGSCRIDWGPYPVAAGAVIDLVLEL